MPARYTGKDTLESAMKLIKQSMKYVDGAVTVSFKVHASGQVTAFRLVAEHGAVDSGRPPGGAPGGADEVYAEIQEAAR